MPHVDNPDSSARRGQTGAHRVPTQDDPMREMKIPMAGDQLTHVRLCGAGDLLADSDTPSDRFDFLTSALEVFVM